MERFIDVMPRCSICERSTSECSSTTCRSGHGINICGSCRQASPTCPACAVASRLFLQSFDVNDLVVASCFSAQNGGADVLPPPRSSASLGSVFNSSIANSWVLCDVCAKLVPTARAWSPPAGRPGLVGCRHVSCEQCRRLNVACPLCRRTEPTGNGGSYVIGSGSANGVVGRALLSRNGGGGAKSFDFACCQCREPCPGAAFSCDYCKSIVCSQRCSATHIEFVHGAQDVARFVSGCSGTGSQSSPPYVGGQQSSSSSSSSGEQQHQQRVRGSGLGFSPRVSASATSTFGLAHGSSLPDRVSSVGGWQPSEVSGRFSVSSSGSDGSVTTVDTVGRSCQQSADRYVSMGNIPDIPGRSVFDPLAQVQSALMTSSTSSKNVNTLSDDLERRLRNLGLQIEARRSMNQPHVRPDPTPSMDVSAAASGGRFSTIDFGNLFVPQQVSGTSEQSLRLSHHSADLLSSATRISPMYNASVGFVAPPTIANLPPSVTASAAYQLFQQAAATATQNVAESRPFLDQVADSSDAAGNVVLHIDVLRDRLNQMVNGFNQERRRASPLHSFYDVVGSDGSERSATCIVRGYTTGVVIQLNNSYGEPVDDDVDLDVVLVVASRGGPTRLAGLRRPEVGRRLFDFSPTSDGLHFVNATIGGRPVRQSPQRFLVVGNYPLSYSFQPPVAAFTDDLLDSSVTTSGLPVSSDDRLCRFHATWNLQETQRLSGGSAGLMKPWGVCVDPSGTQLLVADRDAHRIVIFDLATGAVISTFGQHGPNPGQFHRPTHVAFDSAGRVVVTDKDNHRVQVFADHVTWRLDSIIGGSGHAVGLFRFPWEVAVNRRDDVLVSDSKNFRVQLFARRIDARAVGYRVVGVYAFDSQPSTGGRNDECKDKDGPRGVAFDPFGFVIVADYDRHRLLVLSHDLRSLVHVVGHVGWSAVGQIDRPRGLTVDPSVGNIYLVVSRGNRRINHVVKMCPKTGRCLTYPMAADMCGICRAPGGRVAVVILGTGSGGTAGATAKNGVVILQDTSPF